jgi:hypothetical protein
MRRIAETSSTGLPDINLTIERASSSQTPRVIQARVIYAGAVARSTRVVGRKHGHCQRGVKQPISFALFTCQAVACSVKPTNESFPYDATFSAKRHMQDQFATEPQGLPDGCDLVTVFDTARSRHRRSQL